MRLQGRWASGLISVLLGNTKVRGCDKHMLALVCRSLLAIVLFCAAQISCAHDIAGKATVLLFVKPQNDQLVVLVRVPLEAMSEVQFPVRGPGYLDFAKADTAIADAAQMYLTQSLQFFEAGDAIPHGTLVKTRVSLPSDKSFVDFATAFAHIQSPILNNDVDLYWKQASLDAMFYFPISNANARFSVQPYLNRIAMETHTVLHFVLPSNEERVFSFVGDPGQIELDPSWWRAAWRFVDLGFVHILEGIDHVLFLLCLVIPTRTVRALIPAITAFTVAHSITLISSAFGVVPTATWFAPLIEMLIALSVFYMACENILGVQAPRRWLIVFVFGLIHGFGFSFILADRMQFAGDHLIGALLAFNLGVELGQLVVLMVAAPILHWLYEWIRRNTPAVSVAFNGDRIGVMLMSTLVAHTAWHWCTDRGEQLLQFQWKSPTLDAAFFAATLRWGMLLVGSFAAMWLLNEIFSRLNVRSKGKPSNVESTLVSQG
jgi:HupE / UreJ protein